MAAPAPAAELPALPALARVEELSAEQFVSLPVFAKVAKKVSGYPNSFRLRRFRPGEAICTQGEFGNTAFYLLNREDVELLGRPAPEGFSRAERVHVATAEICFAPQNVIPPKVNWWQRLWRGANARGGNGRASERPKSIPSEGPANVDLQSGRGHIFTGDFLGEESSTANRPRSATVRVERECYGIEILRHLFLDMLRDKAFQADMDQVYRQRVLDSQLKNFTLFQHLGDEQLKSLGERVDLLRVDPGAVIIDQHDPPDAVYIIRSGLVQVVRSRFYLTSDDLAAGASVLCEQLTAVLAANDKVQNTPQEQAVQHVATALPADLRELLATIDPAAPSEHIVPALAAGLREVCRSRDFLTCEACKPLLERPSLRETMTAIPSAKAGRINPKSFSELEVRMVNRALMHEIFPQAIPEPPPPDSRQVLCYLGKGEMFGEMGIVSDQPRNSTCVAFDHPDDVHKTGLVELLRIDMATLRELWEVAPSIKDEMLRQSEVRQAENLIPLRDKPTVATEEFQELGLFQGQRLMVIDLDRCTRCGECVQACIDTHDDGLSRLYLDGPRIDRYLVPTTCRNCRDPVCMIGCPVGSIQRGDVGQIVIRDWCIGCGVCARQCPYDSIQMHDVSLIPEKSALWRFAGRSSAPGDRWRQAKFSDSRWQEARAPLYWNVDTASALGDSSPDEDAICLRHFFQIDRHRATAASDGYELTLETELTDDAAEIPLAVDGQRVEVTAPRKKGGKFTATIPASLLPAGRHALTLTLPRPVSAAPRLLLSLHMHPATGTLLDNYNAHAAVCDQCSSTSFGPACVYACPHEAAIRYDGREGLPDWSS